MLPSPAFDGGVSLEPVDLIIAEDDGRDLHEYRAAHGKRHLQQRPLLRPSIEASLCAAPT